VRRALKGPLALKGLKGLKAFKASPARALAFIETATVTASKTG
jgi:hypothetical protein